MVALSSATHLPRPLAPLTAATTPHPAVTPGPSRNAFAGSTGQLLDHEKMRRLVDALDTDDWHSAWHDLSVKGLAAVPVLLEALERRQLNTRHMAFRLLEQVTGDALTFQADAPDDVRLRQIAYLRAKLEPRRAAG